MVLDTHGHDADTMPMQPIPIPCVAFSGGVRLVIIAIYCTVDHAGTIHPCSRYPCRVWCPVLVVLDTHCHDADTMPMQSILMPCVVSSGGDRHLCSRCHEPDTHAVDTDTMCGILDAHGTDAHGHDSDAVCGILWR